MNKGPSFNTVSPPPFKLNGFYQRFQLSQDDNRMTPGKPEPTLKAETMKGTGKSRGKKGNRVGSKKNQIKYTDSIPTGQPQPTYSGFSNITNKATKSIRKPGRGLKRRRIK